MGSFKRPDSLGLCFLSLVWIVVGIGYAIQSGLNGNILGVVLLGSMALAGIGLWFQSRVAAYVMLTFAVFGIAYALFSIGKIPGLRIAARLCFAIWSIQLLVEYLRGDTSK